MSVSEMEMERNLRRKDTENAFRVYEIKQEEIT